MANYIWLAPCLWPSNNNKYLVVPLNPQKPYACPDTQGLHAYQQVLQSRMGWLADACMCNVKARPTLLYAKSQRNSPMPWKSSNTLIHYGPAFPFYRAVQGCRRLAWSRPIQAHEHPFFSEMKWSLGVSSSLSLAPPHMYFTMCGFERSMRINDSIQISVNRETYYSTITSKMVPSILMNLNNMGTVSYTHLTLPTIYSV